MRNLIAIATGTLLVAACAVGPNYHAPEAAPVVLKNAQSPAFVAQTPEALWWQEFDDRELDNLVGRALASNLDLRAAYDRVRAARAVFVERKFDYAPHISLDGAYTHSDEQQPGFGSDRYDIQSDSVGFDASWELDLFGHVRRSVQAARADLGAERATYRDAQVTVAAEVARNYFELRGAQQRLIVARQNLESEAQTLRLTQLLDETGRGSEIDVQRSRAHLKATEATIPLLEASEKQAGYRLAVLLGERPGVLDAELVPVAVTTYAKALPIGDTSELLRRRPDVRAAERQLAAATARVGVATADLFPRVSVTGFVGFLSGDVGRLFNTSAPNNAEAWSVAPTVSWAAFDLGSVRARLRASKAQADAAAANYEKVVLSALEDTENSLVSYSARQMQLKSLAEQAAASKRAADLANTQYREGVADFLVLLDAQRTQLDAEDAVAQAETAVNVSVVAIYKALGGVGQTKDAGDAPAPAANQPLAAIAPAPTRVGQGPAPLPMGVLQ
ncbi:MAG: TolC family protein [Steroidobacteraceae bacterium]|jgi:multidrug efflux system outer membrane protein